MTGMKGSIVSAALAAIGIVAVVPARAGFVVSPANGNSYEVVADTASSWTQANAAAQAADGHLATITSATEDQFIDGRFPRPSCL